MKKILMYIIPIIVVILAGIIVALVCIKANKVSDEDTLESGILECIPKDEKDKSEVQITYINNLVTNIYYKEPRYILAYNTQMTESNLMRQEELASQYGRLSGITAKAKRSGYENALFEVYITYDQLIKEECTNSSDNFIKRMCDSDYKTVKDFAEHIYPEYTCTQK